MYIYPLCISMCMKQNSGIMIIYSSTVSDTSVHKVTNETREGMRCIHTSAMHS